MKALVHTMLAAGDPDQPIDLLEVAGLPYETVTPPPRHRTTQEPAKPPAPGLGQDLLF